MSRVTDESSGRIRLHNLSDSDFNLSGPAVSEAQVLLAAIAASHRMRALANSGCVDAVGMPAAKAVTLCAPTGSAPDDINALHGTQFADLLEADFGFRTTGSSSTTRIRATLDTTRVWWCAVGANRTDNRSKARGRCPYVARRSEPEYRMR
jgi:hypothetical protein